MTIKLKKLLSLVLCVICIVSTFPVMAFSAADDGTEIIFAIDTSSDMLKYNLGVDSTLADALTGITEQTPQGCTFGVVTKDNITPPSDVETAIQALSDIRNYYGSSNISDVVDNALETFSGNGNRVLFVVTDKWDSVKDKINNLNSDTTAYIICFETDDSKSESIKSECSNAIVCSNARELTYKLADVYEQMLYLPVVSGGTRLMSNSSNGYNSSFRYGKHNYGTSVSSNQKGAVFAALMNMYYLMPADIYNGYEITDTAAVKKIGSGITNGIFNGNSYQNKVLNYWNNKAAILFNTQTYTSESTGMSDSQIVTIEENLKRRFPVMIAVGTADMSSTENDYWLITKLQQSGSNYTFTVYDPSSDSNENITKQLSYFNEKCVKVVDTKAYFDAIYSTFLVKTYLDGNAASLVVPENYYGKMIEYGTKNTNAQKILNVTNGYVPLDTTLDEEFSVAMYVTWNGLLPDIHNTTMNFRIIFFTDVDNSHWARPYIFTMTNQKVINGRGDNIFDPEANATITEYLAMTIRAADMSKPNISGISSGSEWTYPDDYEIYAINKGYVNTADECNNSITRELAFHITWQILCSDDCRTPNQLITYELGEYTSEVPFTDKESVNMKYRDSIAELYKNAIVAGYTDKTLLPQNNITRAETAKTLCKCIERFGDDRQIDVIKSLFQAMERITTGESKNGTLGVDGGYAYAFEVNQTGLYPITLTGNAILTVYKNSGTDDNPTYTKCARKITGNNYYYPLYAGNKVYLAISGDNGTSYSLSIGYPTEGNRSRTNETKTIQIPLYDSPDITSFLQEYCNAHGYSIDSSAILKNRYLDSNGNKYEYTVDFFKNYLKALGNNNTVFSINVRDVYFDWNDVNYGNSDNEKWVPVDKLDEWSAYITPKLVSMIGGISIQIRSAYNSLISEGYTIPMPQICIGSAHFYGDRYSGTDYTDTQRNAFAEKYVAETEQLYNGVINQLGGDSMIYGIYFGKEDPPVSFNSLTDRFEHDPCYIAMVKMAQFIQGKGKKHIWMPYTVGQREVLQRVGNVTNSMMYLGTDNLYHDVFDIVIIQPGFFYKEIHSEEENTELAVMQYDTLKSIEENRVVIYNDDLSGYAPQNGAKLTDTVIGFQIEFDGGLYTGRQAGYDVEKNTSTPKKKAERFSKTVKVFYNALYNSSITFGMYPGGPNEQGFTSDIIAGNNNNKHSYKNHIAYKPDEIANNQYGDGKEYMNFWNTLGGVYYNNSTTSYTGSLILDIIRGVSNNVWTENAQNYYSGLLNFSDDGKLLNY